MTIPAINIHDHRNGTRAGGAVMAWPIGSTYRGTTMSTDWRALCAELVEQLERYQSDFPPKTNKMAHRAMAADAVLARACAALTAEADGPAVPEGREPASVVSEPSDLVTLLAVGADCSGGAKLSPDQCHRAADLLEQRQAAPVPVAEDTYFEFVVSDADYCPQARGTAPTYAQAFSEGQHYLAQYQQDGPHTLELRRVEVLNPDDLPLPTVEHPTPVPVTERLPGPEDCDAEGRCWWFLPSRQFKFLDQCARWSLMMHSPSQDDRCRRTHWLPFHALPLPAGEVE